MKKGKEQLINTTEFGDILLENTKNYNGAYKKAIQNCPLLYNLLCDILDSNIIHKKSRNLISSTIAYFILPRDIYPEEIYGMKGYLDDVYLCLHTLNILKNQYGLSLLQQYWKNDNKLLDQLLNEEFLSLKKDCKQILPEMLNYVGL